MTHALERGGGPHPALDRVPYQSTHNTGGTIMGHQSARQRLEQVPAELGLPQPVRVGANVFLTTPRTIRPSGGALAYWTADAIKNRYVKSPGRWCRHDGAVNAGDGDTSTCHAGNDADTCHSVIAPVARADGDARAARNSMMMRGLPSVEAGVHGIGPTLHGIVGRRSRYAITYSRAHRSGITWTAEALTRFIGDPQASVPPTACPMRGMTNAGDRADLIAYLQKVSR